MLTRLDQKPHTFPSYVYEKSHLCYSEKCTQGRPPISCEASPPISPATNEVLPSKKQPPPSPSSPPLSVTSLRPVIVIPAGIFPSSLHRSERRRMGSSQWCARRATIFLLMMMMTAECRRIVLSIFSIFCSPNFVRMQLF